MYRRFSFPFCTPPCLWAIQRIASNSFQRFIRFSHEKYLSAICMIDYKFYANVGGVQPGEALLQLKVVLSLFHLTSRTDLRNVWEILTHFTPSCLIVFKCSHFTFAYFWKIHLCWETKHFNVWGFSILQFKKKQSYFHILLNFSHWIASCLRGSDIWLRITKQSFGVACRGPPSGCHLRHGPPPVHGTSGSQGPWGLSIACCWHSVIRRFLPNLEMLPRAFHVQEGPSLLFIMKRNPFIRTNCI